MKKIIFPEEQRNMTDNNFEQVHRIVLRMLKVFDIICSKFNIDYWLDYGTLLGAIRHNGFIPWDIEADIGILRSDFDRFLKYGVNYLPDDIFFQTKETDKAYINSSLYIEAKLRDKYSNYVGFSKANPNCKWHNGIQIDIFVYDLDNKMNNCLTNAYERIFTKNKSYLEFSELEYLNKRVFVDYEFPIPIGYDAYLKRNYDDYLKLPLLKDQISEFEVDPFSPCDHSEILLWPKI